MYLYILLQTINKHFIIYFSHTSMYVIGFSHSSRILRDHHVSPTKVKKKNKIGREKYWTNNNYPRAYHVFLFNVECKPLYLKDKHFVNYSF